MASSWHMAGTEGTGEYVVVLHTRLGRVGYRLLRDYARIRVEPSPKGSSILSTVLTWSRGWKQPGDSAQNRFSIVVQREQLAYALGFAIRSLEPATAKAELNPTIPGWIKWIVEQAIQDPIDRSISMPEDGVRDTIRKAERPDEALFRLFSDAFNQDELRTFLTFLPTGHSLVTTLPESGATMSHYARETVTALHRYGLVDAVFFKRLEEERPYRAADIQFVQHKYGI